MSWRGSVDSASVPQVFISYIIERSLEESRRKWRGKLVGAHGVGDEVIRDEARLANSSCVVRRWPQGGNEEGKTVA